MEGRIQNLGSRVSTLVAHVYKVEKSQDAFGKAFADFRLEMLDLIRERIQS